MPPDTISLYFPKMKFPLYTKITKAEYNKYEIGEDYQIRVDDEERTEELGEESPMNEVHEATLVTKEELEFGDIPPVVLAFDSNEEKPDKAKRIVSSCEGYWDYDEEVLLLVFARKDKIKDVVMNNETIPSTFSKEDVEQ